MAVKKQESESGFSFGEGTIYANKDEYVDKALRFDILEIVFEEGQGFQGADRWKVTVQPHDREDQEIITMGSNPARDAVMDKALNYVVAHGKIPNAKLVKSGNAYYFSSK